MNIGNCSRVGHLKYRSYSCNMRNYCYSPNRCMSAVYVHDVVKVTQSVVWA